MLGKATEPLLAELTGEFLTYLRGALVHQMKQGMRLSAPSCRFRQAPEDRVIVDGVDNVFWSAFRGRYIVRRRDSDSSRVKSFHTKSLDDAVEFARTGIKPIAKQQDGEHSVGDDDLNAGSPALGDSDMESDHD